jgi:GTP-binding protein
VVKVLDARFITSAVSKESYPPQSLPEVAIAGRSNVGKSSFINALLGRRKLVRVSKTPGRTRTLNFFEVELELAGSPRKLRLTDLPGYGFAKVSKSLRTDWEQMITTYLSTRPTLQRVVLIVDGEIGPTQADLEAVSYLQSLNKPLTVVATKLDRLPKAKRKPTLASIRSQLELSPEAVLPFSSVEDLGVEQVWHTLLIGET